MGRYLAPKIIIYYTLKVGPLQRKCQLFVTKLGYGWDHDLYLQQKFFRESPHLWVGGVGSAGFNGDMHFVHCAVDLSTWLTERRDQGIIKSTYLLRG